MYEGSSEHCGDGRMKKIERYPKHQCIASIISVDLCGRDLVALFMEYARRSGRVLCFKEVDSCYRYCYAPGVDGQALLTHGIGING